MGDKTRKKREQKGGMKTFGRFVENSVNSGLNITRKVGNKGLDAAKSVGQSVVALPLIASKGAVAVGKVVSQAVGKFIYVSYQEIWRLINDQILGQQIIHERILINRHYGLFFSDSFKALLKPTTLKVGGSKDGEFQGSALQAINYDNSNKDPFFYQRIAEQIRNDEMSSTSTDNADAVKIQNAKTSTISTDDAVEIEDIQNAENNGIIDKIANIPFEDNDLFEIFSLFKTGMGKMYTYGYTSIKARRIHSTDIELLFGSVEKIGKGPLLRQIQQSQIKEKWPEIEKQMDAIDKNDDVNAVEDATAVDGANDHMIGGSAASSPPKYLNILYKLNKYFDLDDLITSNPRLGKFSPYFQKREAAKILLRAIYMFLSKYNPRSNDVLFTRDEIHEYTVVDVNDIIPKVEDFITKNKGSGHIFPDEFEFDLKEAYAILNDKTYYGTTYSKHKTELDAFLIKNGKFFKNNFDKVKSGSLSKEEYIDAEKALDDVCLNPGELSLSAEDYNIMQNENNDSFVLKRLILKLSLFLYYFMLNRPFNNTVWTKEIKFINDYSVKKNESLYFGSELSSKGDTFSGFMVKQEMMEFGSKTKYSALEGLFYSSRKTVVLERIVKFLGKGKKQDFYLLFLNLLLDNYRGYMESPKSYRVVSFKKMYSYGLHLIYDYLRNINQEKYVLPSSAKLDELQQRYETKKGEYEIRKQDAGIVNQILEGIKGSVMEVFDNILKQHYNPLPSTSPSTPPSTQTNMNQNKNPPITNIKKFYYSQDQRLDVLFSLISSTVNNKIRIVCGKSVLDSFFKIYKDDNQINNSDENQINNSDENQINFPDEKLSTLCFSMGGKTVEVMVEAHEGSNKGKEKRLTLYGILEALVSGIKIEPSIENQEKDPRQVFVSPELQHWMTAVCLFLSSKQTSLQLIVSPFLYNPENKVDSLTTQIDKFRIFLEFIVSLIYIFTDSKQSTTISGGSTVESTSETVVKTVSPDKLLGVVKKIKEVSIQIQVQKDVYNFSFDPIQNKIVMRKNSVQKDFFESLPRKEIQLTDVITNPIIKNTQYDNFYKKNGGTNPSYYEQDMVADKFRIETADKIDDDDILSIGFKNFVKRRMGFHSDLQVHGMVYRNHSFVDFFQKDVVVGIVGGPVRRYEYALDYLKREKTFYFLNDLANVPFENNEFFEIFSLSKTIFSRKLAYMRTSNNIVELSNLLTASIMATLIPLQCVEKMHNKMAWLFTKPLPKEITDAPNDPGAEKNVDENPMIKSDFLNQEVATTVDLQRADMKGGSTRYQAFQGWEILILSKINKFLDINDVLYGDKYGYFSPFFHKREACIIVLKAIHSFLNIPTSSPVSNKSLEETVNDLTKSIPFISDLVSVLSDYTNIINKNNIQVSEKLKNDPTPRDKMDGTKTPMEMEQAMKDIRQTLYSLVQILASVIDNRVVPKKEEIKNVDFNTNSDIFTRQMIRAQNAAKYTFSGSKDRQLKNIIFESCKQMVEDKCKKVVDFCNKDETKKEEWMNFIHAMYKSTILAPHFICSSLISNVVMLVPGMAVSLTNPAFYPVLMSLPIAVPFLQGVFLSMGVVDITLTANTAAMPPICLYSMAFTLEFLKKIWIFFIYERTNILKIDYTRNYDKKLLGEIFKNLKNESAFPTTKYNVFHDFNMKQQVQYFYVLQDKDKYKEFFVQEVGNQERRVVGSIDTFTDFNLTNHPDNFFKLKFKGDTPFYVVRYKGANIIAIYNFDDFEKIFKENIEYKTVPSAAPSEVPSAAPSAAPLSAPLTDHTDTATVEATINAPLDPTSQPNAYDTDNEIINLTNVNKNRNYFVYYEGKYRECNLIVKNEYKNNNTYKFGIKLDASNYETIEITTDKQNNINNSEYKLFYDKPSDGMQPASPVGPVQPVSITQIQTKPPVPRTVSNDLQEMLELKPKGPWKYNDENVGSFQGAYNSEDDNNNIVYQFQNKEFSFPIGQEKNEITKFTRPPYDGEDLIIFINKNVSTKIKSLVFIMKDYNEAVDASLNNLSDKAKILRILLTTPEQNVKEPKIAKQFFEIKDEVLETDTLLKKIQNFKEPLPPAGSFVYDLLYVISLIFFGAS